MDSIMRAGLRGDSHTEVANLFPNRGNVKFWKQRATLSLLLFALFAIVSVIIPAANAETIPFPGGVTFQVEKDEMTDKKVCSVFTYMALDQVAVYGPNSVALWVDKDYLVATEPAPMMRIDTSPPFRLVAGKKPKMIDVPPDRAREIIEALYSGKKIAVRWYDWPMIVEKNTRIIAGDFGAAYDHATKICGWPRLTVARRPMSKEPNISSKDSSDLEAWFPGITKKDSGSLSATFPGNVHSAFGWKVDYAPLPHPSCEIRSPRGTPVFTSADGHPQVTVSGEMIFFDVNGQEAGRVIPKGDSPDSLSGIAPVAQIIAAAKKAGDYGFIEIRRWSEKSSLFGLLEAINFAEKTCKLSQR